MKSLSTWPVEHLYWIGDFQGLMAQLFFAKFYIHKVKVFVLEVHKGVKSAETGYI